MNEHFTFLPPRSCEKPYTISEINEGIATLIESGNTLVWVEGEISTWRSSSNGHCYFRLKDAGSQIPAVVWRTAVKQITFKPVDGMAILAVASIRVYQRGGYYQLDVHRMQPLGQGMLYQQFLKLKTKLEQDGLFDASFKKKLPASVLCLGVITSKNGAALRDIIRVVMSRSPRTEIKLIDVAVQGDRAAPQIADAIDAINRYGMVDCVIVGRGGGSIEDLWAFNEEVVARAIFNSKIPVISAVGHEIDFTIADFVADIRAATPSAAAEIVVSDSNEERRIYQIVSERFRNALSRYFSKTMNTYQQYRKHRILRRPLWLYQDQQQQSDDLKYRAERALLQLLRNRYQRLSAAGRQLHALSPLSVLSRGYSVVSRNDGTVIRSATQLKTNDHVFMKFHDGSANGHVDSIISSMNSDES